VAGRARRVEDGGIVVGADLDGRHGRAGRDDVLEPLGARRQWARRPHHDGADAERVERAFGPLGPFLVGDEHAGARVLQAVGELVDGPPGVERHGDGPDRGDRGERRDPFGVVAHADGDAVTLLHVVPVDQRIGDGVDLGHDVVERQPLVLVDEEDPVAARAGQVEQGAQRRQGVLVDLRRSAEHVDLTHGEHLALRGYGSDRLFERHDHVGSPRARETG
jgi:hypothetical protein